MGDIEHSGWICQDGCGRVDTHVVLDSDGRRCLNCGAKAMEYVPASQLRGAVEALKLIAVSHAESAQHAIDVALARNALEAMGVDPSLWRGSRP